MYIHHQTLAEFISSKIEGIEIKKMVELLRKKALIITKIKLFYHKKFTTTIIKY